MSSKSFDDRGGRPGLARGREGDLSAASFRHLDTVTALFVAVLLISNVASTKILDLGLFTFDGGTILFPVSYIFGDVLTEVYGYRRSRKVIWTGFSSLILMTVVLWIVQVLPPAAGWSHQESYVAILGVTPRLVAAGIIGYFLGEFSNSYVLAKMKILTAGRWLWTRTIGSTVVGEGVDTLVFVTVAFAGALPMPLLTAVFVSNYIFKVGFEVLATPLTYRVVRFLKQEEGIDIYDRGTNFNPFLFREMKGLPA